MKRNSFKRYGLACLTSAGWLVSTPAPAQFDGTLDSAAFTYKYEQTVLASTQDMDGNSTNDFSLTGSASTSAGVASFSSGAFYQSGFAGSVVRQNFAVNSAITAEFSLKVTTPGAEGSDGTMSLLLRDKSSAGFRSAVYLSIGKTTLKFRFGTNTVDVLNLATGLDNTNDFHTYRFARLSTNTTLSTFYVWRDDVLLTPSGLTETDQFSAGQDSLFVGDVFTTDAGTFQLDYMRLTSGAFAPVPEPTSLWLVALGMVMMWWQRRCP